MRIFLATAVTVLLTCGGAYADEGDARPFSEYLKDLTMGQAQHYAIEVANCAGIARGFIYFIKPADSHYVSLQSQYHRYARLSEFFMINVAQEETKSAVRAVVTAEDDTKNEFVIAVKDEDDLGQKRFDSQFRNCILKWEAYSQALADVEKERDEEAVKKMLKKP